MKSGNNLSLSMRDKKLIWHPITQEKTALPPITITHGKGAYLYAENNKSYLDLISSWWVNLHGHAHPDIAKSIYEQALKLEQVIFVGFTHEMAVKLCENLAEMLPSSLQKFFFSDNGSTAVEIALKMAYQYWWNQDQKQRKIFISFEGGYHGDTFGAMAVGKSSGFYQPFHDLLFQVKHLSYPDTWVGDADIDNKEAIAIDELEKYLKINEQKIAAFIAEPLIQGASGMRMCRASFLQKVFDILKAHDILVIFDEVMTSFYRTGTMFALQQVERVPDILCISKGITGGFLPLALTITSEKIYEAFLSDHFSQAFTHSHSYTANPIACAAGVTSLNLLQTPKTQARISQITKIHQQCLAKLTDIAHVCCIRSLGTIAAFNIFSSTTTYTHNIATALQQKFLEQGLLIRPLGNTIYLLPPYSINDNELYNAYKTISNVLKEIS